LSGWSEVAGSDVAPRVSETPYAVSVRTSFARIVGAPLGPTVELRGFGAKQCDELSVTHGLVFGVPPLRGIRSRRTAELCAKICIRKPAPGAVHTWHF
jgi:hypothetical protein